MVFEERDRGNVICSSGVGTKNQCNQSTKVDKQAVSPKRRSCGTKEETVMHLVSSVAPSWRRNCTKEDMTILPDEYIGNCATSMDWKAQTGGMSIHLLKSWRMMMSNYTDILLYRQICQWHTTGQNIYPS